MTTICKDRFAQIVDGIIADRDLIIEHNPIGTSEEILLWMLMSCLVSYLSLDDKETPCFTSRPDADTYRQAIRFILNGRCESGFDAEPYLVKLSEQ